MPRTVDSIVANHQAARALRRQGKPVWSHTVNIKPLLEENSSSEDASHIAAKARLIAKLLRDNLPDRLFDYKNPDCNLDFIDTVEMMEECTVKALAEDSENGVDAVEMFDCWLDTLYDWADSNRVWLGA